MIDCLQSFQCPDVSDAQGQTACWKAAERNHLAILDVLRDACADFEKADSLGQRPLHAAAKHGHAEAACRLDLNTPAAHGEAPLFVAAQYGYLSTVQCLVSAGANKDQAADDGLTPLLISAQNNQREQQWREHSVHNALALDGITPLIVATLNGSLEDVRLLLHQKALVDANGTGVTPLYTAAKHGQTELVKLLLEAQADVDKVGPNGSTPLFVAAKYDRLPAAQLLVQAGANQDRGDLHGANPLFIAAKYGQVDMLRFLIEAKADKDSYGQHGATPLLVAVEMGRQDAVEALVDARVGHHGASALFIAALSAQSQMVSILVEAHCDLNLAGKDGATPLFVAAQNGFLEIVQSLCEARANARAVALATGTADVPRRLGVPGEDLEFVTHRPPIHHQALVAKMRHLLVVGAGLSAADAILHALGFEDVRVTHVFRKKPADTKIGKMFGSTSAASMYRDEEWLAQLMRREISDPRYTVKAESQLQEILDDGTCIIKTKEGEDRIQEVSVVALLLGAGPSLHFLPPSLRRAQRPEPFVPLTRTDGQPSSHPYFLEVNPDTLQLADARTGQVLHKDVFALGPLRGDNFIRFLIGDAFVVRQQLEELRSPSRHVDGETAVSSKEKTRASSDRIGLVEAMKTTLVVTQWSFVI
eukprot:symbB.v1.2.010716.t1/scaffold703.1/size171257/2